MSKNPTGDFKRDSPRPSGKETVLTVQDSDLPAKDKRVLETLMERMSDIKWRIADLEEEEGKTKAGIEQLMLKSGETTLEHPGYGAATVKPNTPRKTLDQAGLKTDLVAAGLSPQEVGRMFENNTKEGNVNQPWVLTFKLDKGE